MRDESQNEGGKRDDRTFNGGIRDYISVRTGFAQNIQRRQISRNGRYTEELRLL